MSIKSLFNADGFSLSAGVREYRFCRSGMYGKHTPVSALSSAWAVALPTRSAEHYFKRLDKYNKRYARSLKIQRALFLAKWWVKYNNPVANKVFDLWSALADRGYVKHFDHTCPDNDICQGHNAVHTVDKNGASNE